MVFLNNSHALATKEADKSNIRCDILPRDAL